MWHYWILIDQRCFLLLAPTCYDVNILIENPLFSEYKTQFLEHFLSRSGKMSRVQTRAGQLIQFQLCGPYYFQYIRDP